MAQTAQPGRYRLLRTLGQGASGEVYLVEDQLREGRQVALKCLRARVDDALRAAMAQEFGTVAALSAPGVAPVHDFGVGAVVPGERPVAYFTREYVDGLPLDEAAAALDVSARAGLVAAVASVLAPLHQVGVIHGDLKPANVIVDAAGQPHLIDFGLCRVLGARSSGPTGGTPAYMAPERLRGAPPDVASDVYALGVVLFHFVHGGPPEAWRRPDAISRRLRGDAVEVPEATDATRRALLQVALRAMQADPNARFPTVGEFAVAVGSAAGAAPPDAAAVFVAPRPEGISEALARLESDLRCGHPAENVVQLVLGPDGGGRTTLLRELKWRLQLHGVPTFELRIRGGQGVGALLGLFEELCCTLPGAGAAGAAAGEAVSALVASLRGGDALEETPLSDALSGLLTAAAEGGLAVVLVDDLHLADPVVGAVLRSAVHAAAGGRVRLLAVAGDATAAAVGQLGAPVGITLRPLSPAEVARMTTRVLGPVDAAVHRAVFTRTAGLPGAVVDLLATLFRQGSAPTAADVEGLPEGAHGRAVCEARLQPLSASLCGLLDMLSLAAAPLSRAAVDALLGAGAEAAVEEGLRAGLLGARAGEVALLDGVVDRALRDGRSPVDAREIATRLLRGAAEDLLGPPVCARLSLAAEDYTLARRMVPLATEQLVRTGAHAVVAELNTALLPHVPAPERPATCLALARAHQALGSHTLSAQLASELAASGDTPATVRVDAAIVAARALTALADFEGAVAALSAVPAVAPAPARARAARELAKVHMRRGDYTALDEAADTGLACAAVDDLVRVELLCCKGVVAAYRADAVAARSYHEQALALASQAGANRERAKALTYLGIGCWRAGALVEAREFMSQSLEMSLQGGDIAHMANAALNLGAILFYLGEAASAEAHYERASRLALRAGSVATGLQARNNLAHVHVYFGLYEHARVEVDAVRDQADAAGHRYLVAQATAVLGDLLARTGEVETALIRYDEAIAAYAELGQAREQAEHHMDAAEALLDRAGASDASAAAARLSRARQQLAEGDFGDLQPRLDLLVARTQTQSGDPNAALDALRGLLPRAQAGNDRDLEWMLLSALAEAQALVGADFAAERNRGAAVERLEELALRLPRDHRDAFWQDPRRRAVRQAAAASPRPSAGQANASSEPSVFDGDAVHQALSDPRMERLLEILKRMAGEHDVSRLLERITESAVDLAGAERGLVLLVGADGQLSPHTARDRGGVPTPDAAFSRSIAEAVLIDGEPLVTVDASDDGRLSEFVSVHKLLLRSVACMPIRAGARTIGVLYLEHRRSRGRFSGAVVELLHAFADQAGIALENARLIADNEARHAELRRANAKLERAARELEDLLSARSHELDEARHELTRAHAATRKRYQQHGMVGRSEGMRRVYAAIERLRDTPVPVVICGESGTGKELVARALHYGGKRARRPFIAINCGALPATLLESELFGHVRGSFSGADRDREGVIARASGGTLFLDEVGDMPAQMQVDLLRVLQEGTVRKLGGAHEEPVSIRVLAASQVPLQQLVDEGRFRADLFYRLNVVELRLPPLRARQEDIAPLCDHFLRAFAERDGTAAKRISGTALDVMLCQPWPGNVRQLEHVLLQASIMSDGPTVEEADLRLDGAGTETTGARPSQVVVSGTAAELAGKGAGAVPVLQTQATSSTGGEVAAPGEAPPATVDAHREAEKRSILTALEASGWNRARAAKALGIPRRTFYRRLRDYGILSTGS